jgi:hypothetical protein
MQHWGTFWSLHSGLFSDGHTISSSGVTHLIGHNCRYSTDITTSLIIFYHFFEDPITIMPMFSVCIVTWMSDSTEKYTTNDLQTIFHIQLVGIFIIYLHTKHSHIQTINIKYNNNSCIVMIQHRNFVQANIFCRKCQLDQLHIYTYLCHPTHCHTHP